MMFRVRSLTRSMCLAVACLMLLTQTACVTLDVRSSALPPPDSGGVPPSDEPSSGFGSLRGVVLVVAAVAVSGYLVYKAVTHDPAEENEDPESGAVSPEREMQPVGPPAPGH